MKRQKIRKALILVSFLLFPITLYYLSPYLIIKGVSEGIISGSFLVFAAMFFASLFSGRALCGWLCPAGGAQECCLSVSDRKAKGGRSNWIKYFIWAPWVGIITATAIAAGGIRKVDFLYQTYYGISVSEPRVFIMYYQVVALIVILSFAAGRRAFCHYICWMAPFMIIGTKLRNALKLPSLRLKADKTRCTGCKTCSRKCPMSLNVDEAVKKGCMENAECILCGECVDACSRKAIGYSFFR